MSETSDFKKDVRERLKKLDVERENLEAQLNQGRLEEVTGSIVTAISSPAFITKMREFREGVDSGDGSAEDIGKLFSMNELRDAGAKLPDDFRVSSRTFEDFQTGRSIKFDPGRAISGAGTVSWGACGGAGGLTFCGCAGGGS